MLKVKFMDNKLIIITPCYRFKNLKIIKKTIDFRFIFKWIIIYNGDFVDKEFKQFHGIDKIIELNYSPNENEVFGNGQRNLALDYIYKNYKSEKHFLYFLDDDNIIHKNFYKLLKNFQFDRFYTFDQQRTRYIFSGIKPKLYYIDTAMFLCDKKFVEYLRFNGPQFNADGTFIETCFEKNKDKHVYINEVASYHNYLARNIIRRTFNRIKWYSIILFFKLLGKEVKRQFKP
tara:strand:- start:40 stop:732 length:693 start_codon:yes stop_codon:yes gene_type:complete